MGEIARKSIRDPKTRFGRLFSSGERRMLSPEGGDLRMTKTLMVVAATTLMFSFDAVILTGLFGLLCYIVAPRIMTSIEGDPLLIEDLEGRRAELREELKTISESDEQLRTLVNQRVRRHLFSFSYLIRQYIRREPLPSLLAKARLEFRAEMNSLTDKEQRAKFLKAIESAATQRRVESLIYLHRLLKIWIAPHVITTSIMLVLMIAHIVQVVFFHVS